MTKREFRRQLLRLNKAQMRAFISDYAFEVDNRWGQGADIDFVITSLFNYVITERLDWQELCTLLKDELKYRGVE